MKELAHYLVLAVAATLLAWGCIALCGCNGIDVNVKARPAIPGKPDPNDQTTPPAPPPPKDDWAPPWFRRANEPT